MIKENSSKVNIKYISVETLVIICNIHGLAKKMWPLDSGVEKMHNNN